MTVCWGQNQMMAGTPEAVWRPRQSGKSWLMRQVVRRFKAQNPECAVEILSMMSASPDLSEEEVLEQLTKQLEANCDRPFPKLTKWKDLVDLFPAVNFNRPLILIIDEFDGMGTNHINGCARQFRNLYPSRLNETDKLTGEKTHLLHGLALVGVRSVLGIENQTGSPFNVQRSLLIPNLTCEEVDYMFHWYERESGQQGEQAVIDRVFYETQGQPGLVGWFGELMTETFNQEPTKMMRMAYFEAVYATAIYDLPNNQVIHLISKADQKPDRSFVLNLFNSQVEIPFAYEHKIISCRQVG